MADWIFVVDPVKYPRIIPEWNGSQRDIAWIIRQHKEALADATGDGVFIYMAGVGIIARGEITGCKRKVKDTSGWASSERRDVAALDEVPLRVTRWLPAAKAIHIKELRNAILDPKGAFLQQNAHRTSFELPAVEAAALLSTFNAR